MRDADHKQILELIPAYALNCLDAEESEMVRRHLLGCETCREELAAYYQVVDALPLAAPEVEPSPSLKDRLMERVQPSPVQELASRPAPIPAPAAPSWRQKLDEALQKLFSSRAWRPVALLLIVALAVSNLLLWQRLNQAGTEVPAWRQVTLTGSEAAPEAQGIIYISADDQNGTLIVEGLPRLGEAQQYQLWLIQGGQRASGGVFSVDSSGYGSLQIESGGSLREFDAFGITIEPAGGSPGPTGQRVLGSNL